MARKARKKTEQVYDVEKICGKQINGETVEYLVKWHNYPDSDNTWEPIHHLNCKAKIDEWEEQHKGEEVPEVIPKIEPGNGFDFDWKPIKVFGATKRSTDGRLMIMIKWKGNRSTFEFSEIANQKIPHLVIAYYEQRIRWKNGDKPLERPVFINHSNHSLSDNTSEAEMEDN